MPGKVAFSLSADPTVQFPEASQSLNRYSYVLNNPLSFTDPTGYFLGGVFKAIGRAFKAVFNAIKSALRNPYVRLAIGIAAGLYGGQAIALRALGAAAKGGFAFGVVAGASGGFIAGAIIGGTPEAAFYGGVTGGIFGAIGGFAERGAWGLSQQVAAHGLAGGATARLQGGSFQSGMLSAGFAQWTSPLVDRIPLNGEFLARAGRVSASAVIGGTASVVGGGKFANGAVTGAFSRAFNDEAHLRETLREKAEMFGNFVLDEGGNIVFRTATTIGGGGQILLGGALCSTAVGCAAGGPLAVLGASNIQEGLTGQAGFIRQGATSLFGDAAGNLAVDATNIVSSGAGLLRSVLRPDTFKLFNHIPSDFVPAYRTATTTGLTADVGAGTLGAADSLGRYYGQ